jgi:2-polyprenyl-6-methoxyphenol hydroxylase-like FAD-dependent oxidoreductase
MNSTDNDVMYDVILVGYGPVSEILAVMLARLGHSVAVFERWTERFPLPRAVCIDHEIYRVLSAIGLRDELPAVSHPAPPYRWFNAEWKELLSIDWSAESISGGTDVNFVHQPTMEAMFDRAARRYKEIDINLGWDVVEVRQTDEYAELVAREVDTEKVRTVRGRYLIGADGANSLVRAAIGSTQEDRGFEADWLVIDLLPNEGVTLDIPPAAQYCNPARPTTIVPAGIRDGRYYRRWEFMRMPGESREDLENETMAWRLLEPWVKPDQAVIVRHKVYTFRSLIANTWRKNRLIIAGDAAHVMPPFMGQGMCAGLRDDWNLAWKLNLILTGQADDALLDTYQIERRPHASDIIDLSMYLGKVICIPDAEAAARRDKAFFEKTVQPLPPFPSLTGGLLDRNANGEINAPAGRLSPHGTVRHKGQVGRFDDVVGLGFVLILRSAAHATSITSADHACLAGMNGKIVHLGDPDDSDGEEVVVDLDKKFTPFMDGHGIVAMLVRPDFYIYGGATAPSDISGLIQRLTIDLGGYGFMRLREPNKKSEEVSEAQL